MMEPVQRLDLSTRLRMRLDEITQPNPCAPDANQQALAFLPYKFMHMIPLRPLLPAEQVLHLAYRPFLALVPLECTNSFRLLTRQI